MIGLAHGQGKDGKDRGAGTERGMVTIYGVSDNIKIAREIGQMIENTGEARADRDHHIAREITAMRDEGLFSKDLILFIPYLQGF